jgi:hypothetical protein
MVLAGAALAVPRGGSTVSPHEHRRVIPLVTRDGPQTASSPTPDPTGDLDVVVRLEMEVKDLSFQDGGQVEASIRAEARTTLPGFFGPAKTTLADVFATAHPGDLCRWATVYTDSRVMVTIEDSQGVFTRGVMVRIAGSMPQGTVGGVPAPDLGWHYDIDCGVQKYRVPAFGEESVAGWLGLIHLGNPQGVVIDTPDYNGSQSGSPAGCIKRQGSVQHSDPVWGTARVTVYAVVPGCIVPPPDPLVPPGQNPPPPQNPTYDPGGF